MSKGNERLNEAFIDVLRDENVLPQIRIKKAKYLVKLGGDVNTKLLGKSALSWAKDFGDEELAQFLKEKGAL